MLNGIDKITRRAELTNKRKTVGLTLTESWELINLDAELDLLPMIEASKNKFASDIEEE